MTSIKEILNELIAGDEILPNPFDLNYSHEKNLNDIGGKPILWAKISEIKHVWRITIREPFREEIIGPIIKIEGEKVRYNPAVVKDYLSGGDYQ